MNWYLQVTETPSNLFNAYEASRITRLLLMQFRGKVSQSLYGSDSNNALLMLVLRSNEFLN